MSTYYGTVCARRPPALSSSRGFCTEWDGLVRCRSAPLLLPFPITCAPRTIPQPRKYSNLIFVLPATSPLPLSQLQDFVFATSCLSTASHDLPEPQNIEIRFFNSILFASQCHASTSLVRLALAWKLDFSTPFCRLYVVTCPRSFDAVWFVRCSFLNSHTLTPLY